MAALPPLNPADGALLTRFLLSHENPLALLTASATNHTGAIPDPSDPAPDLLTLLAFLARPDITPWLDHYHALQARARQNAAANILLEVLRDSTDPTQRRLAAAALMGQSRQPSRTLDRAVSQPRSHAAPPAAPDPQPASPDATRHRHTLERPIPNPVPTPVPTPVPVEGASAPAQPASPSPSDQQYPQPSTPGAHSPHHIPSLPPSSVPPCLSGSSSDRPLPPEPPEPAMTLDQAMAVLGIRPELLDIADEIEDAALDGDLADMLEPAALSGSLGRALQRAAEQGELEDELEQAIDNGDHLSDPAIANAFTASRHVANSDAPLQEPAG